MSASDPVVIYQHEKGLDIVKTNNHNKSCQLNNYKRRTVQLFASVVDADWSFSNNSDDHILILTLQ